MTTKPLVSRSIFLQGKVDWLSYGLWYGVMVPQKCMVWYRTIRDIRGGTVVDVAIALQIK